MIRLQDETVEISKDETARGVEALRKLLARTDLGFFEMPSRDELWSQCTSRARDVKAQASHLAVLGIGGSSLGARALIDSLALKSVDFFENVDARDFWDRLHAIKNPEKYHWAVISKSGSTIETLGQMSFVEQFLKEKGLSLEKNVTVVTEKKSSALYDWAIQHKVTVLEVPLDVGGRFSVLSPVGMFPAAFAGLDLGQIREGASWALAQETLIGRLVAQSIKSFQREEWITPFWVYSNRLLSWGLWVQQLWAESLAKKVNRRGQPGPRVSTPLALLGANDQHSILQLIAEGSRDKFIWFVRVTDAETFGPTLRSSLFSHQKYLEGKSLGVLLAAEARATAKALHQNQIQSLCLEVPEITAAMMGAMFMLMELVVGSLGEALDINAFDQPGVELGKRLALDILK